MALLSYKKANVAISNVIHILQKKSIHLICQFPFHKSQKIITLLEKVREEQT